MVDPVCKDIHTVGCVRIYQVVDGCGGGRGGELLIALIKDNLSKRKVSHEGRLSLDKGPLPWGKNFRKLPN
jgi:hypothetical protein